MYTKLRLKLQDFIYLMFAGKHAHDDELYLYITIRIGALFCCVMHVLLLLFFVIIDVIPMALVNIGSILAYIVILAWLLPKRKHLAAGLLFSAEITAYTCFTFFFTGFHNYIFLYFFLVMLMQMIIPYGRALVRACVIAVMWLLSFGVVFFEQFHTPLYDLGSSDVVLACINIFVAGLMTVAEVTIGNNIKQMIVRFNAQKMHEFETQAHTDQLTGLFNRRYAGMVFEELRQPPAHKPWCIAMLDIDDFKLVNDEKGHAAGDVVLMVLSDLIRKKLRRSDFVFRWGGEEFLILLDSCQGQAALDTLQKLIQAVAEEKIMVGDEVIHITVTIGASTLDIEDVEGSIRLCDQRMYEGKNSGKNKVVM